MDLIARGLKGTRLTAAGRALVDHAQGIEQRLAEAIHVGRQTAEGRVGSLRIALGRVALDDARVGRAFESIRREEPGIELEVREQGSPLHSGALLRQEVDLTIGSEETPQHRRLSRRVLFLERVTSAVVPATHPLASFQRLEPAQLAGLPLLVIGSAPGWVFKPVRDALRELGFVDLTEWDSLDTIYALIAAGRGWMPTVKSYEPRPPEGTVAIPLAGLEVELPVSMRWLRGNASPVLARVTRILSRAFRSMAAGEPLAIPPVVAPPTEGGPDAIERALVGRIEARHLRAIATIANDGSVADASRRLGLTQSTVSRQLGAIERIVGMPLFVRSRTGAVLTPAGERIRAGAAAALALVDEAAVAARLAARGIQRRCTIGMLPSPLASERLHDFLRRAPVDLPTVAIEIRELSSSHAAESLRSGAIDVALMMLPDAQAAGHGLSSKWLAADPFDCALVSASGPLARKDVLTGADLAALPLSIFPRADNPRLHDAALGALRRAGVDPALGAAYTGPRTIWRFVADGACWTLGLHSMQQRPPSGVVARPIRGFAIDASLHLVARRDEADPHVRALLAAL